MGHLQGQERRPYAAVDCGLDLEKRTSDMMSDPVRRDLCKARSRGESRVDVLHPYHEANGDREAGEIHASPDLEDRRD